MPSPPSRARTDEPIRPGDVIVLAGRGPIGSGMEETYQITSALQASGLGTRGGRGHRRPFLGRQHRSLHRPRRARGAGRRPDRQGARRRPIQHRGRSRRLSAASIWWATRAAFGRREGGACWQAAAARDLDPTTGLPDDTRLWAALQRPAAAPGGAAFTTCTGSFVCLRPARRRWRRRADKSAR